jgi:hypothetical protein
MVFARGWQKVKRKDLLFNGYRLSDLQDKKTRDLFYNNVNILNTSELYSQK